MFSPPEIRPDQRAIILGKTGSGKSFLMRYLLKLFSRKKWRIVIVDPKKDWQGRGKEARAYGGRGTSWRLGTVDHPVRVKKFDPKLAVQIVQPASWGAQMSAFCQDIMERGNTFIYFDEITQLVSGSHDPPSELKILWTQGRAKNVGAWCGSQRPVNIPVIVKDQAEIWIVFRLTRYEDRQTVEGHVPTEETPQMVEKPLPKHYFWYYTDDMDKPVLVKPLTIQKKGSDEREKAASGRG
jgi:energy-coupling factor transporter ATP-binding protein EcfA2